MLKITLNNAQTFEIYNILEFQRTSKLLQGTFGFSHVLQYPLDGTEQRSESLTSWRQKVFLFKVSNVSKTSTISRGTAFESDPVKSCILRSSTREDSPCYVCPHKDVGSSLVRSECQIDLIRDLLNSHLESPRLPKPQRPISVTAAVLIRVQQKYESPKAVS